MFSIIKAGVKDIPLIRSLTYNIWPQTYSSIISQEQINSAAPLPMVWAQFERWLGHHQPQLAGWGSWGDYDRKQLEQEWQRHNLSSLIRQVPHLNLKQRFAEARQLQRAVGLKSALQLAGLQFNGQQHRALEDARNTARLLPLLLPA